MLVGSPDLFAIESHIELAYEHRGPLALGYFVLPVNGGTFGVRAQDASMLGCSYQEMQNRLLRQGQHTAPALSSVTADALSQAFLNGWLRGISGDLEVL